MDFQCTIERYLTYRATYTEKQREHHLGKIKLTSEEYFNESFDDEADLVYPSERKQFYLQASLNGIQFSGSFTIDPYIADFQLKPRTNPPLEQIDIENLEYLFYEFLYQHPSFRLKLLQEVGPKLTLEEFEERDLNNKTR